MSEMDINERHARKWLIERVCDAGLTKEEGVGLLKTIDKLRTELTKAQERIKELEDNLAKVPALIGNQNGRLARQVHRYRETLEWIRDSCAHLVTAIEKAKQALKKEE